MTCVESNDVEEHNFITLAAALIVYVCACVCLPGNVWAFFFAPELSFFSKGEWPSLPIAGCQFSTMIP